MTRKQFIRDRTGEGYVDVAIAILLIFTVVAGIFSLFLIYTTYQSLNATARQIAHVVEVSGQADDATISLVTGNGSYVNPDNIVFDTTWFNASSRMIQLKTPFTVTISKQVLIPIIRPLGSEPIGIRINIGARASGISEVYWKGAT